MNKAVLKHLLQLFFIPAAGLSLAWFAYLLPFKHPWPIGIGEWSVAALFAVIVLEWACRTLRRIDVMVGLCLATSAFITGLPLYDIVLLHKIPYFGNLLDYGGTVFMMIVVAVITLRYRVDVLITDECNGARRVTMRSNLNSIRHFCKRL